MALTDNQCIYEIQDQSDQALFLVEPSGQVQFQPRGPYVIKVTVQPDPDSGIEGGEGVQQLWVRDSRPRDFPVRTDLDRETTHEVVIECCTDSRRRRTCPDDRLVRATPAAAPIGHADDSAFGQGAAGPAASAPARRATEPRVLGPRMKVLE